MRRHAHRRLFAKLEKKLKNGVSHFFVEFDREVAVCNAEQKQALEAAKKSLLRVEERNQ